MYSPTSMPIFTAPTSSYRAYRLHWSAQPLTLPAVAADDARHPEVSSGRKPATGSGVTP